MTSFNFEDNDIKINFAKAKFIFSVVMGTLYGLLEAILYFFRPANIITPDPTDNQAKSFILFLILTILSLLREKYEK